MHSWKAKNLAFDLLDMNRLMICSLRLHFMIVAFILVWKIVHDILFIAKRLRLKYIVFKPQSCNLKRKIPTSLTVLAFDVWSSERLTQGSTHVFLRKQIQEIPGLPLMKILVYYKTIIFPTLLLHFNFTFAFRACIRGILILLIFYSFVMWE